MENTKLTSEYLDKASESLEICTANLLSGEKHIQREILKNLIQIKYLLIAQK